MNHRWWSFCRLAMALCAVVIAGCAKKKAAPKFDLVPVTGVIKMDGQPMPEATVAFYLEGTPPEGYWGSAGTTDAQGRYELRSGTQAGALPGAYKVTVSRVRSKDGQPLAVQEGIDIEQLRRQGAAVESVAARYSDHTHTELKVTVDKAKADGYDFELKSG